ncbi:hypothetical protein D3C86_943330 [compost metagenome]
MLSVLTSARITVPLANRVTSTIWLSGTLGFLLTESSTCVSMTPSTLRTTRPTFLSA